MKQLLSIIGLGLILSLSACSEHSHDDGSQSHDAPTHRDTIE